MEKPKITIYGTHWCGDCYQVINFFKSHNIDYQWIDIDTDLHAEQFVIHVNRSLRSMPTIILEDGSILVEPSRNELEQKLRQQ